MGNTVTATFKEGSLSARATGLWQWDYGQILEIVGLPLPRSVELHIVRKGDMITRIGLTEDGVTRVAIPDDYLETSDPITIYVYLHTGEDDGETEYRIILPIIPRPKPVDYDIEDHEVSVAYQALIDATEVMNMDIETVMSMKNTTEQYMTVAEEKANEAHTSADNATNAATESRSWAVGGTGTRSGEDTNNSKWWSEKAAESAAEVEAYLERETDTQIGRVITEGNRQVQRVESAGSETIDEIETAGNGQIEDIEAVGTTQVNAVKAEGVRQAQDISDSKDEVVEAVSAEGTRQIGIIASKESETTNRITAAGNTQVDRVNQMGTTQYYAIGSLSSQQKLEIQNLGNQTKNTVSALANVAKSYAVGDTGTRPGEDTDNAKYYAERAAECVLPGGYVLFTVGDDGHLNVSVADPLSDEVYFAINEETGHLEVTVE